MPQDSSSQRSPLSALAVQLKNADFGLKSKWLGLIGAVAIVLMTWLPTSYYRMVLWPWVLIWQIGFLALGVWLITQLRYFQRPFYRLGYGFDWAIAYTGVSLIICSLASDFRTIALWNVILAIYYGFALYGFVNWARQIQVRVNHVAAVIASVTTVTALISLSLWRPSPEMWQSGDFDSAVRNFLPFGHHNFVGGYFSLAFPFVLACAFALEKWPKWVARVGALLIAVAVYASGSRGALLGVLVWVVIAVIGTVITAKPKYKWRAITFGGFSLALAAVLLFSNPRIRDTLASINLSRAENSSDFIVYDGPVLDRYFMLKIAANILGHDPFTGVGPGVMSRVSNLYRPITTGTGLDHIQQLHNTPAQLIGEMGLLGIGLYLAWLLLVTRLWLKLLRQVETKSHRLLVYGIGGSYLAYGVSSLTDYQLENIGISALLTALLALLILIADQASEAPPQALENIWRRSISLSAFVTLVISLSIWLLADISFALGDNALKAKAQGNVGQALNEWSLASAFAPWDPTYDVLAGQQIAKLLPDIPTSEQDAALKDAIGHFAAAVKTAPNDVWFNYNLAALLLGKEPEAASIYAGRAIQLLPRNNHYSYYLLGQSYLNQRKVENAISAFAIEGMANPEFLVMDVWNEAPYSEIKAQVLERALSSHNDILNAITPSTRGYVELYNQTMFVRWWHNLPLLEKDPNYLSPVLQSLFAIEESPQQGIALVDQFLTTSPEDLRLQLLKAWLNPDEFAEAMLQQMGLGEPKQIMEYLHQNRDLRQWLSSFSDAVTGIIQRNSVAFVYRNGLAQTIDFVIQPIGLRAPLFVYALEAFPNFPREFPVLDQTLETVRSTSLGLPSAVHNNFSILPASVLRK